jgi:hypothetical protein
LQVVTILPDDGTNTDHLAVIYVYYELVLAAINATGRYASFIEIVIF